MGTVGEPQEPPQVLTVEEARALTGGRIGRNAMYAYVRAGFIPHIRVGKKVLIPRRRFLAWLNGDLAEGAQGYEARRVASQGPTPTVAPVQSPIA